MRSHVDAVIIRAGARVWLPSLWRALRRPLEAERHGGRRSSATRRRAAPAAIARSRPRAPVFAGDVIKTDRRGTAQILFADETKMVIGPNSQVSVDNFVFQGPSKAGTFAINAVRGSFRFITGVSAKNAYSINTPMATIGVRGTEFDGHVAADGTTTVAMWHGRCASALTRRRPCRSSPAPAPSLSSTARPAAVAAPAISSA